MRTCNYCKYTEEEIGKFPASYGNCCSACKNGRPRYGLNRREQNELLDKQGGKCALCKVDIKLHQGRGKKSGQIDHKPGTGVGTGKPPEVRGVLCFTCNKNISNMDYDWFKKAAKYLYESL